MIIALGTNLSIYQSLAGAVAALVDDIIQEEDGDPVLEEDGDPLLRE